MPDKIGNAGIRGNVQRKAGREGFGGEGFYGIDQAKALGFGKRFTP